MEFARQLTMHTIKEFNGNNVY